MRLSYTSFYCAFLTLWGFFANNITYFILILDYGNDITQKSKFKQFSYLSSKWVIEQQRQLTTSTTHLAQELLMNVQCSDGSGSFAKETGALKMRSTVASHQKLTMAN